MPASHPSSKSTDLAIGIDGCRGGWVVASCSLREPQNVLFEVRSGLDFLAELAPRRACIDIPIGLSHTPRTCDALFRSALPGAASRVFTPPCREALACTSWREANAVNKSHTGKGLSQQAFNIMHKIREVDELLARESRLRGIVREIHPEILFASRAGRVLPNKKTADGISLRIAIIKAELSIDEARIRSEAARLRRDDAQLDDVLDAAIALVVARAPESAIRSLPQPVERDDRGLAMEMIYLDEPTHTSA